MKWTLFAAASFLTLPLFASSPDGASDAPPALDVPDFGREVRPILADACFDCHGPDEAMREADMRLDTRAGLFEEIRGTIAVVPGSLEESELWLRISADADPMPPEDVERQLSAEEKDVLRRWIEGGAPYDEHWSFRPIDAPAPPEVANAEWVKNEIDRFVLARLESEGVEPSAAADPVSLLRRVTLDLTGLPPTPEQLDRFLGDPSDETYEALVDELLASTAYAERQAQEWLDVARYADSNGDGYDGSRTMWRWRDWVIDSFKAGLPYDQFVKEQVAGDLIPESTKDQKIATGFLRNHPIFTKGGALEDEYRHAYVVDRVSTVGTAFLGLTIGCAQCHDHKYDPISQQEFYGLYAFFNNASERDVGRQGGNTRPVLYLPDEDDEQRLLEVESELAKLADRLEGENEEWDEGFATWCEASQEAAQQEPEWSVLEPDAMISLGGAHLERQADGSILARGWNPGSDTYQLIVRPGKLDIQALRLEVLPHEDNPSGGSGRSDRGTFSLSELEVHVCTEASGERGDRVVFAHGEDDHTFDRSNHGGRAVDGSSSGSWSIFTEEARERHEAVFVPEEPIELNESSALRIVFDFGGSRRVRETLGRFRLSFTQDEGARDRFLPIEGGEWSAIGPFPELSAAKAMEKVWAPEDTIAGGVDLDQKFDAPPAVEVPRKGEKSDEDEEDDDAESEKKASKKEKADGADAQKKKPAPEQDDDEARGMEKEDDSDSDEGEEKKRKLRWEEKRDWKDSVTLEDPASAWYVTRKLTTRRDVRARVWLDGGEGVVVWVDGERVHERPVAEPKEKKDGERSVSFGGGFSSYSDPDFDPDPKDPDGRSRSPQRFPDCAVFDLPAGEHELVMKLVTGGEPRRQSRRSGGAGAGGGNAPMPEGDDMDGMPDFGGDAGGGGFQSRRRSRGTTVRMRFDPLGEDVLTLAAARALRELATPAPTMMKLTDSEGDMEPEKAPPADEVDVPEWAKVDYPDPRAERRKKLREYYVERVLGDADEAIMKRARLTDERSQIYRRSPNTMVMNDDRPRVTRLLVRGAWDQPGDVVEAHTPAVLPPLEAESPNRLDLAEWLISDEHPLTARVAVNRFWAQHFGRGLVGTPGDYGIRGEAPTHAGLLDWLAQRFRADGWDVRALHKQIVTSATYRQSSDHRADLADADPDGELFAHMPRMRLPAESIRDHALAASGLLHDKVGGESIRPFQPSGIMGIIGKGSSRWGISKGDERYRRGLYVFWKRGILYPSFALFDAPTRSVCTVERVQTNTPLQALVLLNDQVYVEAGRALGIRMVQEGGASDGARLAHGFRLATSRMPTQEELRVLLRVLAGQREHWNEHSKEARRYLRNGSYKVPKELDLETEEAAAWAAIGHMLLNLDAALHRS